MLLRLQRSVGNAAVTAAVQRHSVAIPGWDEIDGLSVQRQVTALQRLKKGDAIPTLEKVGSDRFGAALESLDADTGKRLAAWINAHRTDDLFELRAVAVAAEHKAPAARLLANAAASDPAGTTRSYGSAIGLADERVKDSLAKDPPPAVGGVALQLAGILSRIRKDGDPSDLVRLDALRTAPDLPTLSALTGAWVTHAASVKDAVNRLLRNIGDEVRGAAIGDAKQLTPQMRGYAERIAKQKGVTAFKDLDPAVKQTVIEDAGREWAATEGLEAKQREKHFASLTKHDLLTLPTIARIYHASGTFKTDRTVYDRMKADRQKAAADAGITIDGGWNDPLVNAIDGKVEKNQLVPDTTKPLTDAPATVKTKVKTALTRVQSVTEPEVLAKVPAPEFVVVNRAGGKSLRAYYDGKKIYIGKDEAIPVIAHETGHHLEQIGAGATWATLQGMAYGRLDTLQAEGARTAKGGGSAAPTMAQIPGHGADEVTFPVPSPAEGAIDGSKFSKASYTFKYYEGSGAGGEVVSMAMQWLADPDTTVKFVDKDPSHAASVLFHAIPKEFADAGLAPPVTRPRGDAVLGPLDPLTI